MKNLLAFAIVALLSGCASNDYTKFYTDHTAGATKELLDAKLMPYSGVTQIYGSKDLPKDIRELDRRGYLVIGESAFQGAGNSPEEHLRQQAKLVGADIVILRIEYQGSSQTAMPMLQYNPGQYSTTQHSGTVNATAYGQRGTTYGTANYTGTSTTTTPGTFSTSYIPVTLQNYARNAVYLRKGRPPILGVKTVPIPDQMRRELKRNTGAVIDMVLDGSPAFRANLLPGDIIIGLDEMRVDTPDEFSTKILDVAGRECNVKILREGKELIIPIKLNPTLLKPPSI